eukprot:15457065-Alexandrium_andersonii.AAC.1
MPLMTSPLRSSSSPIASACACVASSHVGCGASLTDGTLPCWQIRGLLHGVRYAQLGHSKSSSSMTRSHVGRSEGCCMLRDMLISAWPQ